MKNFISGIDFFNLEAMKYWSAPSSWPEKRKKEEAKSRIFSGEWLGSQKRDGAWYKLLKDEDGNCSLTGRARSVSGEYLNKIEWLPQIKDWVEKLPNGTCLLGEVYSTQKENVKSTTSIMNCLQPRAVERQQKDGYLTYYVFDVLAYNGDSFLQMEASRRFSYLNTIREETQYVNSSYVEYAVYYGGETLWNNLQAILASGHEGMVITRAGSTYQPGKRPSKDTLKVKQEISETIDCFFTGRATKPEKEYTGKELENWKYYINTMTNEKLPIENHYKDYCDGKPIAPVTKSFYMGYAGSLEIALVKDDKIVPIGLLSGLSEEIKANPASYKGKVIEVAAMQIDPVSLKLRHGKMIRFRDDKKWNECEWGQLLQ